MGWNDHLADPDAWEQHVETLATIHDNRDKTKRVGELRPSPQAPRSGATFVCRVVESVGLAGDECDCGCAE